MYNQRNVQRETLNSRWRILFILEHDQSSYLFYDVYTLFTELIYQVKAKRTLSLPHDEVHANKSSFICAKDRGKKRAEEKQKKGTDKVQIQRKKEEREVLCRHRVARGERGESSRERSRRDAEQTGFVLKALQLIDRMRACLAIQGRVSCHWRGTEDWRGRMKNATQTEEVCMPTFLYLSSSLSVHAASLSSSFFRDSKRWMEVGLLGTLTVLYLLCYVSFHGSEWLRQFILMVTVTAFYCTRGSQHFLAFK